jgi:putative MATE family efflux protein
MESVNAADPKALRRRILAIAIPIAVSGIAAQAQMLIDTAFLGHYSTALADGTVLSGTDFLSAVGNVFFPYIVSLAFMWSLTTGTIVLVSQRIGAGKPEEAKLYAEASIKYNAVLSIALYLLWMLAAPTVFRLLGVREPILSQALDYLRWMSLEMIYLGAASSVGGMFQGLGVTRPEMWTGILRSVLNVILDWIMIFGKFGFPEMGAAGAGLATSLSGLIANAVFILIAFRMKGLPFRPSLRGVLGARFRRYLDVAKVGLPSSIEDSLWNFGNLILAGYLNALSAGAVGIYRLVTQIEGTPVFFYYGIARAVTTLVGNKTGERDITGAQRVAKLATRDVVLFCVSFVAAFLLVPKLILGVFTADAALVAQAAPYLMIVAVTMIPRSINIVSGNAVRGYGDTVWMLATQIAGLAFVISASWVLIFPLKFGMAGLFVVLFADETLRGVANTLRFYSGEYSPFHKKPA